MDPGFFETEPSEGGGVYILLSRYHEECVERLKEEIPSKERRWESDEGRWWISEDYAEEAAEIVSEFFEEG